MIIVGKLNEFEGIIRDNIELGMYNNEIKPILSYGGQYFKRYKGKSRKKSDGLCEIVSDIVYIKTIFPINHGSSEKRSEYKYLITRSVKSPTLVSLVYCEEGNVQVWRPTFEEIFEILGINILGDIQPYEGNIYKNIASTYSIIREIRDQLVISHDIEVSKIVDKNSPYVDSYAAEFTNDSKKIKIHQVAFYSLIKEIMISEDLRFKHQGNLGKEMLYLAICEYLKNGMTWADIKEKYKIPNTQYGDRG